MAVGVFLSLYHFHGSYRVVYYHTCGKGCIDVPAEEAACKEIMFITISDNRLVFVVKD